MFCLHCGFPIRFTEDNVAPWVHLDSGNAWCDVLSIADVFGNDHTQEATPDCPTLEWHSPTPTPTHVHTAAATHDHENLGT